MSDTPGTDFLVTEAAMRPASDLRRCFYCHQAIGHPHTAECVLVQKTVLIKMTVTYPIKVPAHWTKEQIESHRNDRTWCASNAIEELDALYGDDDGDDCMCCAARFDYAGQESAPFLLEK